MKSLTSIVDVQTVKVSEKGQIAIPAKMRRRLGLRRGSTLLLIEDKGRILLAKAERAAEALADDFSDLTKHAEQTFRELWDNEADEVWNDL
jgi:AbrB family looped-hinge helix DNA binding protein